MQVEQEHEVNGRNEPGEHKPFCATWCTGHHQGDLWGEGFKCSITFLKRLLNNSAAGQFKSPTANMLKPTHHAKRAQTTEDDPSEVEKHVAMRRVNDRVQKYNQAMPRKPITLQAWNTALNATSHSNCISSLETYKHGQDLNGAYM